MHERRKREKNCTYNVNQIVKKKKLLLNARERNNGGLKIKKKDMKIKHHQKHKSIKKHFRIEKLVKGCG